MKTAIPEAKFAQLHMCKCIRIHSNLPSAWNRLPNRILRGVRRRGRFYPISVANLGPAFPTLQKIKAYTY